MKKVIKIFFRTMLCLFLSISSLVGFLICQETKPAKNEPTTNNIIPPENKYTDIPVCDELRLYGSQSSDIPVYLTDSAYTAISDSLNSQDADFRMVEYYGLDKSLNLYQNRFITKQVSSSLLTNSMLDADKLFQTVMKNNQSVTSNGKNTLNPFYTGLETSNIIAICDKIAEVINQTCKASDIAAIANTLERLTIFQRVGSPSNAYISTELAFVCNPGMIEIYKKKQDAVGGSPETVWEQVMTHEIMHLIQHGANDNNDNNGIETGFCRMYNLPNKEKTIPIDSLYFTWLLEAGAELGMSEYLAVEPGTYQKKISYARSYNLSRFYEIGTKEHSLENLIFMSDLEKVFDTLELKSDNEKLDFLKFMYSIEITQTDPEELWEYYKGQTGKSLTEDEKTGVRMDIRTDAIKYLTKNFFENIITSVHEGALTDLDTLFYLLRLWELDTFNHLNYTEISSLNHAEDFILWYDQTQTAILTAIAECSDLDMEQILTLYYDYHMQTKTENSEIKANCNLNNLTAHMQNYIPSAKQHYASSTYSYITDVAKWLKNKGATTGRALSF